MKKKPTIKVLNEFEQGNERVLLFKDGRQFAVVKIKTVNHCITKKYEYGELADMQKVFSRLVEVIKKEEKGNENERTN